MSARARIDHLVVTSPNLKSGVQWVRDALGVTPQLGGKHERMGTHNCLLRLGDSTYLEVISPDPNASAPGRARWFDMDNPDAARQVRLATWVVRTDNISSAVKSSTEAPDAVESMSRGDLNWLITVTEDGGLRLGGLAPALIQWQSSLHPAQALRDAGCSLVELQLHTPEPARLERLLRAIDLDMQHVTIVELAPQQVPHLSATIQGPLGIKTLTTV
ncbi:MAG: VOC family protein [Burkholderiales bacterium]